MQNRGHREPDGGSESDAEVWRRYTSGVRPLQQPRSSPIADRQPVPSSVPLSVPPRRQGSASNATPSARPKSPDSPPDLSPGIAGGLDQRTLVRLKRGGIRPETQIDLHRMTQDEAHAALIRFLAAAQQAGRRCVLVITGKGFGSEGAVGVLKTNVPRWINESPNRERVLACAFAAGRDGGEGALYVLLRRSRSGEPSSDAVERRR